MRPAFAGRQAQQCLIRVPLAGQQNLPFKTNAAFRHNPRPA
jgi:hypothetical protein